MKKTYKISLFIALSSLLLLAANFVLAQGKGYFLEKAEGFYIFDNLIINGYLSVEQTINTNLGNKGIIPPGDVLVDSLVLLDEKSNFYFCKDQRHPYTNAAENMNCADKLLIWKPESLVVESDLNRLITNKISALQGKVILNSADAIRTVNKTTKLTGDLVKVTGCFSNIANAQLQYDCKPGELKTGQAYLDKLLALPNSSEIVLNPSKIIFTKINLGRFGTNYGDGNEDNEYLCWAASTTGPQDSSCPNGSKGGYNSKWNYIVGGVTYQGFLCGQDSSCVPPTQLPPKLCCFLNVTF